MEDDDDLIDDSIFESEIRFLPEISEEDRTFFRAMDIIFSQYHQLADTGYYYEAECEDTFSFNRFQVASEYFYFYQCHQALKANQKMLVKYVNIVSTINRPSKFKHVIHEFDLIRNYIGNGLVDVFLICSRVPNIFFLFLEIPNETLEDYLFRHTNNTFQYYSSKSKSFNPVKKIPVQDSKFITKSMAGTLLEMHKAGIFHRKLSTNSVFIFSKEMIRPSSNSEDRIVVKLANLALAVKFDRNLQTNQHRQMVVEDKLRTDDLICLYNIVLRIVECTEFPTFIDRERFLEVSRILVMREPVTVDIPIDGTTSLEENVMNFVASQPDIRLETFLEFLWVD